MARTKKEVAKLSLMTLFHGKPVNLLVDDEDDKNYYCSFEYKYVHPPKASGSYIVTISKECVDEDYVIRGDIFANQHIHPSKAA